MAVNDNYLSTVERENVASLYGSDNDSVRYVQCNFIESDLRDAKFIECEFEGCTISAAKIDGTLLQASFKDCKIEGINFFQLRQSMIELSFENCLIRHSSFATMKLMKTNFTRSTFDNVDFADADLAESKFANCEFRDCVFQNTNLSKADFVGARGYAINPMNNKIKKAKFDMPEVLSLLAAFDIKINH